MQDTKAGLGRGTGHVDHAMGRGIHWKGSNYFRQSGFAFLPGRECGPLVLKCVLQ